MQKQGVFYLVSVGPGDAGLLTLKAKEILDKVTVIFAPHAKGLPSRALKTIEPVIDTQQKQVLSVAFDMQKGAAIKSTYYDTAKKIISFLSKGLDAAFICLGDYSIYGTGAGLLPLIKQAGFCVSCVAGVTSFCAAASVLEGSLCSKDENLFVIAGDYSFVNGSLQELLKQKGKKVLVKCKRHSLEIADMIQKSGLNAKVVFECGSQRQKIFDTIQNARPFFTKNEYFFVIIID